MTDSRLGVVFDMDGVLVDSYHAHLRSWQVVAAEQGRRMTEEEFAAGFGRTSREIIAMWEGAQRYDDRQIAELDRRKEAVFREILAADFPAMPGVHAMLRSLAAAGLALAVGSSGPPENVELVLDRLGERGLFGAVVHGMDVTRGKPDPQVFLTAAARLGIAPGCCAVVEDAPPGIEAAHAAGMAAVGFPSTGRTGEQLAAAEVLIGCLDDLTPEVVRAVIAAGAKRTGE